MTVNFNSVIRMMGMLLVVLGAGFLPAFIVALVYHSLLYSGIYLNKNIPPFSNPAQGQRWVSYCIIMLADGFGNRCCSSLDFRRSFRLCRCLL